MRKGIFLLIFLALLFPGRVVAQKAVKVGVIPIIHALPFHAALDQGYLEREGVKAEAETVVGGAVAIPAVVGGSLQLALSAYTPVIKAWDAGFDMMIVFPFSRLAPGNDPSALITRADTGIKEAKQLEGKTIGVNTLHDVTWLYISEWMTLKGADPRKVQFVEVPFPPMMGALRAGRMDAVYHVEPFIALEMERGGLSIIDRPFIVVNPDMEMTGLLAGRKWVSENQEQVERLARGLRKAIDYVNAHPEEWARLAERHYRIKPEWMPKMVNPLFRYPLKVERLQFESDLAHKWGLIKKKQRVADFVWLTATR